MAWTDQCKMAFQATAEYKIGLQRPEKRNVTKVIREISRESGIPYKTLERWYYTGKMENSLKNEGTSQDAETTEDKSESAPVRPVCRNCGQRKVEVSSRTERPLPETSKYFGFCSLCRKELKNRMDEITTATADEEGHLTVCPKCNHEFFTPQEKGK